MLTERFHMNDFFFLPITFINNQDQDHCLQSLGETKDMSDIRTIIYQTL